MINSPPFKAALVGLGAIAQGYGSPSDTAPYCHAGGILKSSRWQLTAAADPFEAARTGFSQKWGEAFPETTLYADLGEMLAADTYDCVAVCVRGPYHQEIMRQVFEAKPRLIFLEKPPTPSLQDQDELLELSRQSGVPVTVSYSRHWGPNVLHMEQLVRDGLIGEVQSVVAYCGGHILSFASHTTELLYQFATATAAGAPVSVAASGLDCDSERAIVPPDFAARGFEIEPTLTAMQVRFSNGVLGTQVGSKSDHGPFCADVFGSKGRVRVGFYGKYAAFDLEDNPLELPALPEDQGPFFGAYEQIASYLENGPLPDCTNDQFASVNEIGFAAIESIRSHGAAITLPNQKRDRFIYANG
jgi:predicted dehydrogenase